MSTAGKTIKPVELSTAIINDPVLIEHVTEIRRLGKRAVEDVIEIGRRLTECRGILGYGNWLPWLDREFGWSEATAHNFMHVFELAESKSTNFADLNLSVSTLYLLAAPSTPEESRTEIINRVEAGEQVPVAEVKKTIARGKRKAKGVADPAPAPVEPEPAPTDAVVLRDWKTGEEHVELEKSRKSSSGLPPFPDHDMVLIRTWLETAKPNVIARTIIDTIRETKFDAVMTQLLKLAVPKDWTGKSDKSNPKKLSFGKTVDASGSTVHALEQRGKRSRVH